MGDEKEKPTYKLVYTGRRFMRIESGEKLVQVFVDARGGKEERFYHNIKFVVIGRAYYAYKDQCPVKPVEVEGFESDIQDIRKWEALETIALGTDRRRKLAKRYASDPRYLKDLPNLARICEGLRPWERASFVEFLVDMLMSKKS